MMKKYYLFSILLISFILFPSIANAEDMFTCDYKEKARLNAIASNIVVSIDYIEKGNSVEFIVTLSNLHPDVYIIDNIKNTNYYYNEKSSNPNEIKLKGYKNGVTVRYEVHTVDRICRETLLLSKYAALPPFNKYYKDPVCKGLSEISLCKKWVRVNYDYEEFKKQVEKHKNNQLPVEETKEDEDYLFDILQFYLKYYIYILPSIALFSVGLIIVLNRKKDFRF